MNRNRKIYSLLIALTLIIGMASRKFPNYFLPFLGEYLGDTLWALLVFWLFGFLFKRERTIIIILLALFFSYAIEISQLYHAPWIDSIRSTRLGGLVLGYGFLWTDLICYTCGIIIGACLEFFLLSRNPII